ncbi:MAG: nucleotide exchange factor GrpE [Solirubrobacteraceae bacterium]
MDAEPDVHDDERAAVPIEAVVPPLGASLASTPLEQGTADPATTLNDPVDSPEPASSSSTLPVADEAIVAPADADQEPSVAPTSVGRLQNQSIDLAQRLEAADQRADELAAIARKQSEMVDELHRENRTLRGGEIREAIAPLVRGLARLSDDLTRMQNGPGGESADLTFLESRVGELLHDCGVLAERPELGAAFDPQVHQATGSATTDDPSANRTIAELRRAGLRRDDGRVLRPADVVVYRYIAPATPPPGQPAAAGGNREPSPGDSDDIAIKEGVA